MGDDFKDPCIVGEDQGADEQSRNQEPADKDANSAKRGDLRSEAFLRIRLLVWMTS